MTRRERRNGQARDEVAAQLTALLGRPVEAPNPQARDMRQRRNYTAELGSQAVANRVYTAFYRQLAAHAIIERQLSDRAFALNDTVFVVGGDVTRHPRFLEVVGEAGFRALIQGALEPRPNDTYYDQTLQALAEAAERYASLKTLFERIKKGSELV